MISPAGWASALAATLLISGNTAAAPFPTRDLNPLLTGVGLPSALPARLTSESWSIATDLNWASTALIQRANDELLIVDAETREARVTIGRAWASGFGAQLEVPYRYAGGGVLDQAIDGWHDLFNLPEGARAAMPTDGMRIVYERSGTTLIDIDASVSGLADASLDFGYSLHANTATALAAWLTVKLPTGDAGRLTGTGATDVSLGIAGEHRLGRHWSVFGQAAVTWLGDGDRLASRLRDLAWSGFAGVGWRAWRGLQLKAQLDAHTSVFEDTDLDFLGDAVVLTVGGDYQFESRWRLDLAVSEDIAVESASDVVFVFGLARSWR